MSHRIEEKAERVAFDLSQGQMGAAANELRRQVECNPREALQIIQMANQMRDHRSPDHVVVQNGNVFIRDERHHTQVFAGRLGARDNHGGRQEDCDPRFPNRTYGGRQEDCDPRFPNRTNGNWNQNSNANPYHGGFDRYGNRQEPCDNNNNYGNRPYQNGNYGQPDCPPVYRRPEVYQQPIYIPDCYGNGDGYGNERRGINPGAAAALIIGGAVLGRVLSNHGNNGNFSVRARF